MTSRIEIDILLPLWHQSTKKGKDRVRGSKSLIIVTIVATFVFFILTAGTTLGIVVVCLHSHPISGGKRGQGIIIKRRHRKGELIKVVDTHPIGEVPLVAYEHIWALTSVTTPSEHALKHPKDTTRGGGRGAG
jgi:hypothetical protein